MRKVKLNPNAQKWVDALRSGKYKQARRRLRYRGGMCCLGVACDIAAEPLKLKWRGTEFDGEKEVLPPSVQEWLGINSANGSFVFEWKCLSDINDNGAKFDEIADLIEQNAEELGVAAK